MKKSLLPALGVCVLCFGSLVAAFAAPKTETKMTSKPVTKMAAKPVSRIAAKPVLKKKKAEKAAVRKSAMKATVTLKVAPKMAPTKK